jgi:peptide/nickel transport system substrate-binding protein
MVRGFAYAVLVVLLLGLGPLGMAQERYLFVELTFNPVGPEYENGKFNPFSIRPIREAMNIILDREFIAKEIYNNTVKAWLYPLSPSFLENIGLTTFATELGNKYAYDFDRGKSIIYEEMKKHGATLQNDVWYYKGTPVTIRIIARIDDERELIAEYVATQLRKLGFTVEIKLVGGKEAAQIVFNNPPSKGEWEIYTGSWLRFPITDEETLFNIFYTPRGLSNALWQTYKPIPEFDTIAQKLANKNYTSQEELKNLVARALELCLLDSIRIWLVFALT